MRRIYSLCAVLMCWAVPLAATVILSAEFREIVTGSQIIVHGRVIDVQSEWVEGQRRIDSLVTLQPSAFYRGTPTATVTFRVPGGQVGRYKSVTVGAPEFHAGDEAVLFLRGQGPAIPSVFGLNQGVFRVRVDARSGGRLVILPALMAKGETPERVVRGARDRRPLPLDQFGAQVRAVLLQQGGAQ
ncbi:MAG TPA: hypothetical protein VNJ03_01140 [Vicinamibacterales bacterium]|nr:hypothetical protein [Vicinamibacterales bacterium]